NRQCPPRKETRSPSGRCVHRAASSRTYCLPGEREGLKKTRATTSQAFWAAGNRRPGACADSRVHCLPEPHETQSCAPATCLLAAPRRSILWKACGSNNSAQVFHSTARVESLDADDAQESDGEEANDSRKPGKLGTRGGPDRCPVRC